MNSVPKRKRVHRETGVSKERKRQVARIMIRFSNVFKKQARDRDNQVRKYKTDRKSASKHKIKSRKMFQMPLCVIKEFSRTMVRPYSLAL